MLLVYLEVLLQVHLRFFEISYAYEPVDSHNIFLSVTTDAEEVLTTDLF